MNAPSLFDSCHSDVLDGRVDAGMSRLIAGLDTMRASVRSADEWTDVCTAARRHPLATVLEADPYTFRALNKPRGYAGDAVMLDLVYRHGSSAHLTDCLSPSARALHHATISSGAGASVRWRRRHLADTIVRTIGARPGARILSVACGHLREIEFLAHEEAPWGEFLALDQDPESICTVGNDYADSGVRTVHGSVRGLIKDDWRLGRFDLIYAAGLYDYLPHDVACRLTRTLLDQLEPTGSLLIANFTDETPERGYMEAFMDWRLIYRSIAELESIATDVGATGKVMSDPYGRVAYLSIEAGGESAI